MDEARVTYILTPPQRRTSSRPLTQPGDTRTFSLVCLLQALLPQYRPRSETAAAVLGPVRADADTMQPTKVSAFDLAGFGKCQRSLLGGKSILCI